MLDRLTMKLETGCRLQEEDRERLARASAGSHHVSADTDIIREGERPSDVHLITNGLACRYKITANGERQIMALLLPGDFCDLHVALLREMDHSIGALTACTVVDIPRAAVEELTTQHPRITRALWWATLVDEAILREWLVSMGRRPADQRLAHFFCEMMVRLRAVGLADGRRCSLPLSQAELADILGLSVVHVNRSLTKLRQAGLAVHRAKQLEVLDWKGLSELAGFNPNYLHQLAAASGGGSGAHAPAEPKALAASGS